MALRTNYKDDVYSGNRKYSMTNNPDTTVSFTDETDYTQRGDTYGAAQINEQNTKINDLDSNAYRQTDTAETSLNDNDYVPFYDVSATAKRKVLLSKFKEFLLGAFAPKVHDSNSAGTYGAGTGSKFGHIKLSDSYITSDGAASSSIGASSQAVYDAYRNRAPINHATSATTYGRGDASNYGHVKLNDAYSSNSGAASAGVGASGKAVYDAYTNLDGKINTANGNISSLSTRMGTAEGNITSVTNRVGTIEGELTANGNRIYMDYKNGKYGYNTSSGRGASTFHPFSDPSAIIAAMPHEFRWGGYHGTADGSSNGHSEFSLTMPENGSLGLSAITATTSSEMGSATITITNTSTGVSISNTYPGSNSAKTLNFSKNNVLTIYMEDNVEYWKQITATVSLTWTLS